jgi:hypothetical protein
VGRGKKFPASPRVPNFHLALCLFQQQSKQTKISKLRKNFIDFLNVFHVNFPSSFAKMKRPCPWSDDHQPMLKVHHSEKDETIKLGAMDTIYNKTLQLLFNGANRKNNNHSNIVPACVSCLRPKKVQLNNVKLKTCGSCSGSVCDDCLQGCAVCQQGQMLQNFFDIIYYPKAGLHYGDYRSKLVHFEALKNIFTLKKALA